MSASAPLPDPNQPNPYVLLSNEAQYRHVFDHLLEGVQIIGFDWRYLYINETAAQQARQPKDKLLSDTMIGLFPGIEKSKAFNYLRTCMEQRTAQQFETQFDFPDNTHTWVEVSVKPIPEGIFILSLDITERKRAEMALTRYAQRLEILHQIDTSLIVGGSVETLAETALKRLRELVPCQRSSIWLVDASTSEVVAFALNFDGATTISQGIRIPLPPDFFDGYDGRHIKVIDDFHKLSGSNRRIEQALREGLVSGMNVLLMDQDHPVGALSLVADTIGFFTSEYQDIAAEIANQLSLAIGHFKLSNELEQRNVTLEQNNIELQQAQTAEHEQRLIAEALGDSLAALTASLDIETVMQQILTYSATVIPSEAGTIMLRDGEEYRAVYSRGYSAEAEAYFKGRSFPIDPGLFNGNTFYFASDTRTTPHWKTFPLTAWIRSSIGVPIVQHGENIGLLIADSETPNRFQPGDVKHLQTFARYAALALENAYHVDQLEQRVVERTAELTEAKERVEAILNNSNEGILLVRTDLSIQQTNTSFNCLFACEPDHYFGHPLTHLIHEEDAAKITGVVQTATYDRGKIIEIRALRKDGTVFDAELNIGSIKDEGFVCTIRDITERKHAEQALNAKIAEEHEFQTYLKALHEITIELTQIEELDTFFKRCVELGLERLGFERVGLFLYDDEKDTVQGTYGTDPHGKLADEHHMHFIPDDIMLGALNRAERFYCREQVPLYDNGYPIGFGWNAATVLWNGTQHLGWLVADNFLHQTPASKPLLDILALYGMTIGTLLAQKQTQLDLRDREERFRQYFELPLIGMALTSPEKGWIQVNDKLCEILGYRREELFQKTWADITYPDDLEADLVQFEQLAAGKWDGYSLDKRFIRKNGQLVYTTITIRAMRHPDGRFNYCVCLMQDITERKRTEEALRKSLEKEKELGELKSRFVSMASHEFRTPLATILAVTETLTAYRHRLSDEQIDVRLLKIEDQIAHLKGIIDDVLQLTRMQAQRMEFNPKKLNLDELCRSVIDEFQNHPNTTHNFIYRCDEPLHETMLDTRLMRQILANLISNAIKYSQEGKTITVGLEFKRDSLAFKVQDEGIGIPEADLKHLFEAFHRGKNVETIPGTGLGLVITKEAVELHGGTITCESEEGKGTTFTVHIPLQLRQHPVPESALL